MLRDDIARCPRDGRGLDASGRRLYCGGCAGVLVMEDELQEMIAEMEVGARKGPAAPRALALEPVSGPAVPSTLAQEVAYWPEGPRRCPRCPANMTKHVFYGMLVDRCEAHGIWFDDQELQAALNQAGDRAAKMPLGHKIAATAAGVAWIAFHIASVLVQGTGGR